MTDVQGRYEIHATSKSKVFAQSIQEVLQYGRCPWLEDEEHDGVWRNSYVHVPARERPPNWRYLGSLLYVFEVIRPALVEQVMPGTRANSVNNNEAKSSLADRIRMKPCRLIAGVDDAAERRIYLKAQEVLRKIRSSAGDDNSNVDGGIAV